MPRYLTLLFTVMLIPPALAQTRPVADQSELARMEHIVRSHVADRTFMGAVLVARGDQILLSEGYGTADLEWNVPNTPVGQRRAPIYAEANNIFFATVVEAKFEFVRDATGSPTALLLHQGGAVMKATRE